MTQEATDARIILRRPLSEEEADRAPRPRNVAKLLTRLQPRSPSLVPRKGSGGYREPWEIEDGVTIAAALGSVASRGPGPAFAVTVLCLRWWPEYVFGPEVARSGEVTVVPVPLKVGYGRTERVVKVRVAGKQELVVATIQRSQQEVTRHRSFRPPMVPLANFANRSFKHRIAWSTIPERLAPTLHRLIDSGLLVASLMDEYINPNQCPACRGYGQDVVLKDAGGGKVTAAVVDCPMCIGSGNMPWGLHRRATAVGIRAANYKKYLAPSYNAVLGTFRDLESRAARALVRELSY